MATSSQTSQPSLSVSVVALPGARCLLRRGARRSLALARSVSAQPVSLPLVRRSVALGGPWGRKNHRLSSRSASAFTGGRSGAFVSSPASGVTFRLSLSARCCANHSVKGTACKLRLQVPSALRAPAAPYLER